MLNILVGVVLQKVGPNLSVFNILVSVALQKVGPNEFKALTIVLHSRFTIENDIFYTFWGHILEANAKLNIEFCEKSFSYSLYIHQNEFIKFSAGEKSLGGEHPTIYAMSVQVEPPVW